eukprot:CAMPEP_0177648694 /NCGR_PEP_ID=MMETSP0447-20121125/10964_1 /TAXON_ID=0 /ORGANISM="Stygamoeba regulata, Strain BSH-02190019" /LENGTH=449 /DNA_ID=CAMNT_0019151351 /DNA_START=294 /DNA_END=1643 /DNA_ORIENTATION=+
MTNLGDARKVSTVVTRHDSVLAWTTMLQSLSPDWLRNVDYCQAPVGRAEETEPIPDGFRLRTVEAVLRHGDRVPTSGPVHVNDDVVWNCTLATLTHPTELSNNNSESGAVEAAPTRLYRKRYLPGRELLPGNCLFGQLTTRGAQQHRRLGEHYRSLYVDKYGLLPPQLDARLLYVRSTDVSRTLQSAQENLLGLYPVTPASTPGLIRYVDLHTMDDNMDNMTPNSNLCPELENVWADLKNQEPWKVFLNVTKPINEAIAATGLFNGDPAQVDLDWFGDTCDARICHGKPLPPGISDALFLKAWIADQWENNYLYGNVAITNWTIGSFVQELVLRLDQFVDAPSDAARAQQPRFSLYSGHDSTLIPLTSALGLTLTNSALWPPYASHVELELWSDAQDQFYVRTLYNGLAYQVPSCTDEVGHHFCPYAQWRQYVAASFPIDYAQRCHRTE